MNNALLVHDIMTGALTVLLRSQEVLKKSASENRDVSDDEVRSLHAVSSEKAKDFLKS